MRTSLLVVLLLVACSRKAAPAPAPEAAPTAEPNPFVRTFPFTTATITYAKKDGTWEEITQIKGGKVRRQTTKGMFAGDDFSVTDAEHTYNVVPSRRQVIVLRSDTGHLFEAYRGLGAAEQALVRASIAVLGSDIPYYAERLATPLAARDIQGLHASCYRLTPHVSLPPSDVCYFRGITLETTGINPIDENALLDGVATSIVLNAPLDDALFAVPADFARETPQTDATMHDLVYAKLVDRMKQPTFTLASLDRFSPTPK